MQVTTFQKLAENGYVFVAQRGKILQVSEGYRGQFQTAEQVGRWLRDPQNGVGLVLGLSDIYVLDCDGKTVDGQWVWEWLEATGLLSPLAPCVTSPSGGRKYAVRIPSETRVNKRKFAVPGLSGDKHTELSLLTDRATWSGQHPNGGEFTAVQPLPPHPLDIPEFNLDALEALAPATQIVKTRGTLHDDWVISSSIGTRTVAEWASVLTPGVWASCRVPREIRDDHVNSGSFTVSPEGQVMVCDHGDGNRMYHQGGEREIAPKPAGWAKSIALPSIVTTRPRIGRGSAGQKPVKVLSSDHEEFWSQGRERRGILYEQADKFLGKRIVYLRANLGSGKTQSIAEYVNAFWHGKRVLAVTHRQSLARDLAKVLDFECYLDHERLARMRPEKQPKRLVCSVDSLPKLMTWEPEGDGNATIDLQPRIVAWDLVILDEACAVTAQAHAATLRGSGRSGIAYASLQNLCTLATQVIAADAFLGEYAASEVRRYCAPLAPDSEILLEQRFLASQDEERSRRIGMRATKAELFGTVLEMAKKGLKVWIACSSLSDAKILDLMLQTATGGSGIVISGDHDDPRDAEFLADANACIIHHAPAWVIATPAVESGVSVTVDYFDAIAVCGDRGSVGVDALLQMSMRVRCVRYDGAVFAWVAGGEQRVPTREELIRDKTVLRRMTDDLVGKFGRSGELVQWFPADADHYESRLNCEIEQARQRADLAHGWRTYWLGQGCSVTDLPPSPPEAIAAVRGAMAGARALVRSRRAEGVANADNLTPEEIADLERAYSLTPAQRKALIKQHLAEFFEIDPCEVTAGLADLDNRARYRTRMRALADVRAVMAGETALLAAADARSRGRGVSADASNRAVRATARLAVLTAAGLFQLNRPKGGRGTGIQIYNQPLRVPFSTAELGNSGIGSTSPVLLNITEHVEPHNPLESATNLGNLPPLAVNSNDDAGGWVAGEPQALARLIAGGGKSLTALLGVDLAAYCRKDQLWRGIGAVAETLGLGLEGKRVKVAGVAQPRQYRLDGETALRAWHDSEPALARLRDSAEGVDVMRERVAQRKADRQLAVIAQLIQDVLDEAK